MADFFAVLGHWFRILTGHLGIDGANGLQPVLCILGLTIFLLLCGAVHSAARMAFLRCSVRK